MHIKEGLIPTVVGTCVTATGLALKNTNLPDSYRNGIIGFGLAHVVLGSMGMMSENSNQRDMLKKMSKAVNFK
nr:asparagine synthase [Sedimentibacter sp.]